MNLWFRLLALLITTRWRKSLLVLESGQLHFRVWPGDLDINVHMNNARYLSICDLGRMDMLLRSGLWKTCRKYGWMPVLAATTVRYQKSLKPFQRFQLSTRLAWWDDTWMYIEHVIHAKGVIYAIAMTKGVFVCEGEKVPTVQVIKAAGGVHDQDLADFKKAAFRRFQALSAACNTENNAVDMVSSSPDWAVFWQHLDKALVQEAQAGRGV